MSVVATEVLSPPRASSIARTRFAATNEASQAFFAGHSESVSRACHAMAGCFQAGGRLLVHGEGAQRSDVAHVVVEFMHPVVVGKRALPALALADASGLERSAVLRRLETLGRRGDILMVLSESSLRETGQALVAGAASMGMLTIALSGAEEGKNHRERARFSFAVPSADPCIVQETHEMLYHILWELVHVFLDHRAVGA